jgi:hypothetical protein
MKTRSIQLKEGVTVTITQVLPANSHGDVYSLCCSVSDRGWVYGRGDTSCKDALESNEALAVLATTYMAWVYRTETKKEK